MVDIRINSSVSLNKERLLIYSETLLNTKDYFKNLENIKNNYINPQEILEYLTTNTGFNESLIEKSTEMLLRKENYNIVDLNYLENLLRIQNIHKIFPNIKHIIVILNQILSNIEINKSQFQNEKNFSQLLEILKDTMLIQPKIVHFQVFNLIVEKVLILENFNLLHDQYLIYALFILNSNYHESNQKLSINQIKFKFFIEY